MDEVMRQFGAVLDSLGIKHHIEDPCDNGEFIVHLRAISERYAPVVNAQAGTALLRQALQQVQDAAGLPGYNGITVCCGGDGVGGDCSRRPCPGHTALWAVDAALKATPSGQSLLDHIQTLEEQVSQCKAAFTRGMEAEGAARDRASALEEQVRLLRVIDAGCSVHMSYHARTAPRSACATCNTMWEARQALDKLKEASTNG